MTVVATRAAGPATYPEHLVRPRLPRLLAGLMDARQIELNQHERSYGLLPLTPDDWNAHSDTARRRAARLIDVVDRSGLTGRGGAGFPVARKLRSVASGAGPAVVVANGCEGEPASRKDRMLLSRLPHLVLDGITMAAFAVGARDAYLAVHGDEGRLAARLDGAIQARNLAGIDPVPIQLVGIDARYVASEQTAIVQRINGGPGLPTFAPRRTHERGVANRPTAVNNVETLAHLALIARYGHSWFRATGTPSAPGTTLVTISGAIASPGVYEVELGTPIGQVLTFAGGPIEYPQAVLVGGYFGTWLPAEVARQTPLSHDGLRAVGGAMGAGILIVLPQSSCGLAETTRVLAYLASESAGQCGPCMFGLPALAEAFAELTYGSGPGRALERVAELIPLVERRGACRHPDGAAQLAASALASFEYHARWHSDRGPCAGVCRPPLLPVPGELEYL